MTSKLTIAQLPQEFKDMLKDDLADIIADALYQFCPSEVDVSRHIGPGDIENWLEKRLARKLMVCGVQDIKEAGDEEPKSYAMCHKCGRTGPGIVYYHIGGEGYLPLCVDTELCLGSSGVRR